MIGYLLSHYVIDYEAWSVVATYAAVVLALLLVWALVTLRSRWYRSEAAASEARTRDVVLRGELATARQAAQRAERIAGEVQGRFDAYTAQVELQRNRHRSRPRAVSAAARDDQCPECGLRASLTTTTRGPVNGTWEAVHECARRHKWVVLRQQPANDRIDLAHVAGQPMSVPLP